MVLRHRSSALVLAMLCFWLAWAVCAGSIAGAEIYRWTDAEGNAHFSDQPPDPSSSGGKGVTTLKIPDRPSTARQGKEEPKEYLIPFKKVSGGMLVDVVINDRVPARMLVDTGATSMKISVGLLNQLEQYGSSDTKKIRVLTAGGIVEGRELTLEKVELGGAVRYNVKAAFTDEKFDAPGYDGLLGMSFLSGFRMTIDYDLNMIHLER